MSTPLTKDQAVALLRAKPDGYTTPEQLRALAAQVDANSTGRVTLLYSGPAVKGIWSTDVINVMREAGENIRVINASHAAMFLESDDFYQAYAKAHGFPDFEELVRGGDSGPAIEANKWLYHPTEGPWADASARFANSTRGEVLAIVGEADPGRVFGAIELPRILANPHVTTIENIPRETLLALQERHGQQAAFDMVAARARERVGELRVPGDIPANYAGKVLRDEYGVLKLDSRTYFQGTQIEGKTPTFTGTTHPLNDHLLPPTQNVIAGRVHVEDWQAQLGHSERTRLAAQAAPGMHMKMAMGAGVVASLVEAKATADKVGGYWERDNPLAAHAEMQHYVARGAGGWIGGAATGFAAGWETGPGVIAFVVVGAVAGSSVGERVATWWDDKKIYRQTDRDGIAWEYTGRAWIREQLADTTRDHAGNPTKIQVAASYEKSRELDFMATNTATLLAVRELPGPRDPYRVPASQDDPGSLADAPWVRDPRSGDWQRNVATHYEEKRVPHYERQTASPERAMALDKEAETILRANIANSEAALAARYQAACQMHGFADFGQMLEPMRDALSGADRLLASDGKWYQFDASGDWMHEGKRAEGNTMHELDASRALLQTGLAMHAGEMKALPSFAARTPEQRAHDQLMYQYRLHDTELKPDWLAAIQLASERTRQENGVDGGTVTLLRNADGKIMADSPIQHAQVGSDGISHVVAVTSSEQILAALEEVRATGVYRVAGDAGMARSQDSDTSTSSASSDQASSPTLVLGTHTIAVAAQQAQARAQEEQAREQQAQVVQAHLARESHAQEVTEQQIRQSQEQETAERQLQQSQAREFEERQAQRVAERESEARQRQEAEYRQAQESQEREATERDVQEQQVAQREAEAQQAQQMQLTAAREIEAQQAQVATAQTDAERQSREMQEQQAVTDRQAGERTEPLSHQRQAPGHETHSADASTGQSGIREAQEYGARVTQERSVPVSTEPAPGSHQVQMQASQARDIQASPEHLRHAEAFQPHQAQESLAYAPSKAGEMQGAERPVESPVVEDRHASLEGASGIDIPDFAAWQQQPWKTGKDETRERQESDWEARTAEDWKEFDEWLASVQEQADQDVQTWKDDLDREEQERLRRPGGKEPEPDMEMSSEDRQMLTEEEMEEFEEEFDFDIEFGDDPALDNVLFAIYSKDQVALNNALDAIATSPEFLAEEEEATMLLEEMQLQEMQDHIAAHPPDMQADAAHAHAPSLPHAPVMAMTFGQMVMPGMETGSTGSEGGSGGGGG